MRKVSKNHAMKFSDFQLILSGFLLVMLSFVHNASAQGLYTARGYWEETTKETYRVMKQKQSNREPLSDDERSYVDDFETYLRNYWLRLSDEEKNKYGQMKATWDRELLGPIPSTATSSTGEYDWRGRDRAINVLYGAYYGATLLALIEPESGAAAGIPLITGGLWVLGPFINPKKYENIDQSVIRASNTGKFLGLINGGALGLAIGGEGEDAWKIPLVLSSIGSIGMGEWGFQMQKKQRLSEGHIEMFRHYGILGPWLGLATTAALGSENAQVYGASVLAGSAAGLIIGHRQAQKYPYTKGDLDNVSTLTVAATGLSLAVVAETLDEDPSSAVILIPAAASVLGTIWGQKAVKGVYLSNRQGSTIGFSALGASVVGIGLAALFETGSPGLAIGLPSAMALATQQILFSKYKKENRSRDLSLGADRDLPYRLSFNLTPENYLINKRIPATGYLHGTTPHVSNPLATVRLSF